MYFHRLVGYQKRKTHEQEELEIRFETRFHDATVERKRYGKGQRLNVEFELLSSGFEHHLPQCKEADCYTLVYWENDWNKSRAYRAKRRVGKYDK